MSSYTSAADFAIQVANSREPILAQFSADWCAPCRALAPVMDRAAAAYEGVTFLKLNVDECRELAEAHNVRTVPTLILFKDGVPIERLRTAPTLSRIAALLDTYAGDDR